MLSLRGQLTSRLLPIAIAQAVGVACGIAGVMVNSHLMPPDVLGHYGVFLTIVPIGMWIVHAGVVKFVARDWATSANRPALLRRALALWAARLPWLAAAAVPAAFALGNWGGSSFVVAWIAIFPSAALLVLGTIAQNALQSERAHWPDCLVSTCGSLTRTFVPPLVFLTAGASLVDLWAGFGVHALVFALAGAIALQRYWKGAPRATDPRVPDAAYTGALFVILAGAGWLLSGVNRWLVAAFFGETEAGYFTLAGGAAVVLASTLGAVFVQFFQPGFYALGDQPGQHALLARRVDRAALGYAITAIAGITAFALIAPWLVGPVIAERYRGALPWILPSGFFGVTVITLVFFHTLLLAGRRERACGPVELTTAAVLLLGCAITAAVDRVWFSYWLLATPLIPWLLTRPLARRYLFKPDST